MKMVGYLATSYKAYWLARKGVKVKLSVPTGDLPWWHSTVFLNRCNNAYYSPLLTRHGVHKVSNLFYDNLHIRPHLAKHIPPTWLPVYQSALPSYVLMPPNKWSPPAVWSGCQAKSSSLALMASSLKVQHRSPADHWKAFWAAKLPPLLQDFVFQCLWYKLKMRTRLEPWLKTPACPLCRARETVFHALYNCAV